MKNSELVAKSVWAWNMANQNVEYESKQPFSGRRPKRYWHHVQPPGQF
jgi:hypothetical protein